MRTCRDRGSLRGFFAFSAIIEYKGRNASGVLFQEI
jgi:hypothetical protein